MRRIASSAILGGLARLLTLYANSGMRKQAQDGDWPASRRPPTQPFATAPRLLARAMLTADEAWGITDDDRAWCRATMRGLRAEGIFTPPSLKGTLVIAGNVGGMAWGGVAHDRTARQSCCQRADSTR